MRSATILANMASLGAALEFLLNPIFGHLSDIYGRKPFLVIGSGLTVLCRLAVAFRPSLATLYLDRICTSAIDTVRLQPTHRSSLRNTHDNYRSQGSVLSV